MSLKNSVSSVSADPATESSVFNGSGVYLQEIIQSFIESMTKDGVVPQRPSEIKATSQDEYATLAGDKKPGRIGYCLTIENDGFAHGNYVDFKSGNKGKWTSIQNNKKLTAEEKTAYSARLKQAESDRQARIEKGHAEAAKKAQDLWEKSEPCEDHPYLKKKGIQSHGLRVNNGNLIIPLYQNAELVAYQTIDTDCVKLYQTGGKKNGSFSTFGTETGVICVAEGWATSASIHEATGYYTFSAMDVHNVLEVSKAVRKLYPDNLIIICSDNDQWRTDHKGKLENIGVIKGQDAAGKINGFEIHPEFPSDDMELRTDWNDYTKEHGLEAVKSCIDKIVNAQPKKEMYVHDYGEPTIDDNGDIDLTGDMGLTFKILGYNGGNYYYFSFDHQQIFCFSAAAHTLNNICQLADMAEWIKWANGAFDFKISPKEIPIYAFDAMKKLAVKRGVFMEGNRVRGCGAWVDAGRIILHCGDKLLVDGVITSPRVITSRYVYSAAENLIKHNAEPLSTKEAHALREICAMPTWENPLSGLLLAGWLVIAPVCAALAWRPHIWVVGASGSGKSTLIDEIIRPVLGEIAYNVDGGTTESAIRNNLGYDARPIVYDEAEGKGNKVSLMDGVLGLATLASKGGVITKFGQKPFTARSSFCFSAINPPIKTFASETRISMMSLKKNISPSAQSNFKALMKKIHSTITPDYGRRMLARTIKYMPVLLKNIKIFRDAANTVIKDARAADQVSAMLAGLWMLNSTREVTEKEAIEWITERDWTEHTAISEDPDHVRLLHYISTSIVTVKQNSGSKDYNIGTLISCAIGKSTEVSEDVAKDSLKKYSILARRDGIFFGNKNHNLEKILKETDWAINWNKTLARTNGSKAVSCQYFGAGDRQRATMIPADLFSGESTQKEIEFEADAMAAQWGVW